MANTPQAEGVDRQVEGVESPVNYVALAKPDVRDIPKAELTEGFTEVSLILHRYRDEKSVEAKIKEIVEADASLILENTYFLWNQRSGRLFSQKHSSGPWVRAAAQRQAGFTRLVGSAHQHHPGFAMREEDLYGYVTDSHVYEDWQFAQAADYLEAKDWLSEPFVDQSDPEVSDWILAQILSETVRHDGFESLVLHRPQNGSRLDTLLGIQASAPAEGIHLSGPRVEEEVHDLLDAVSADESGEPRSSRLEAPTLPRLELSKFRGPLPNIAELAGSEWARIHVANRVDCQQAVLEVLAERIGHGARVYVEGSREKPQILVPITIGFAG